MDSGENVTITDLAGNTVTENVIVTGIVNERLDQLTIKVTYSTTEPTNKNVDVTITGNKELAELSGWTLSTTDKKVMTKTYTENVNENITITDTEGTTASATISIKNIDKVAPKITVSKQLAQDKNSNKVTISADEEIKEVEGWTISTDKRTLSKTYTDNTPNGGEKVEIVDLAGNKTETTIEVTDINKAEELLATVSYSTKAKTNKDVTVTITANKSIKKVEGWTLLEDANALTKIYSENTSKDGEDVTITDENGQSLKVNVKVENIDKKAPVVKVSYELSDDKKSCEVTITSDEEIQKIDGWELSDSEKVLTKTYTKNTDSNGEKLQIKDLAGNIQEVEIKITNINSEEETTKKDLKVNVEYETKNGKVIAKIIANNELQKLDGWTLSSDKLSLTKTYDSNIEETVEVKDIYNNIAKVNIKVTTIQKNDNTVKDNDSTKDSTKVSSIQSKNDNSLSNKILPKTGMGRATLIIIAFVLIGIAIFLYKKNKYWKDI